MSARRAFKDPEHFAVALLGKLGIAPTRGAVQAMVGWERAEGGHWNNTARYNPLNTTLNLPGSGDTGTQGNISVYRSPRQGLKATAETLRSGSYKQILAGLRAGDPNQVAQAIGSSPWGTSGDLIQRTIASTHIGSIPDVGSIGGSHRDQASTPGMVGLTQPKFTERTGVDMAAYEKARKQALVGAFIAQRRPGSILARLLPQQAPSLADFTTTTNSFSPSRVILTPGKPQRTPQSAATPIIKGAKPGIPAKHLTSIGGIHETAGLPGFPAKDYFAPAGSAVVAPVTGKVYKESGYDPKLGAVQGAGGPLGWSVYILGKNGKRYYLTHMGSRLVKVGQRVQQGQKIGTVANYDKYGRPSHIHMGIQG